MKVDKDCSHHMFVTAPLPKFVDSSVIKHGHLATGESAFRPYEELNKKGIQSQVHCVPPGGR